MTYDCFFGSWSVLFKTTLSHWLLLCANTIESKPFPSIRIPNPPTLIRFHLAQYWPNICQVFSFPCSGGTRTLSNTQHNNWFMPASYSQNLLITLCIDCFICRLTAVFITVFLDCIKIQQSNNNIKYQWLTITYWILIRPFKNNSKSLIVAVHKYYWIETICPDSNTQTAAQVLLSFIPYYPGYLPTNW